MLVVVQPRALQQAVLHREAERLHEVQRAAGVRRQADHVARVRRDLGLDEDDVEHRCRAGQAAAGVRAATHTCTDRGTRREQRACRLPGRRAGGHHVVHEGHVAAPDARPRGRGDDEAAAHVQRAALGRQAHLPRGVVRARQHAARRREGPGGAPRGAPAPRPGCSRARAGVPGRAASGRPAPAARRPPRAPLRPGVGRAPTPGRARRETSAPPRGHPTETRSRRPPRRDRTAAGRAGSRRSATRHGRSAHNGGSGQRPGQSARSRRRRRGRATMRRHTAHRLGKARAGQRRPIYCPPHGRHLARCARGRAPAAAPGRAAAAALAARRSGAPHGRAAAGDPRDARTRCSTGGDISAASADALAAIYPKARRVVVEPTPALARRSAAATAASWWSPRRWAGRETVVVEEPAVRRRRGSCCGRT